MGTRKKLAIGLIALLSLSAAAGAVFQPPPPSAAEQAARKAHNDRRYAATVAVALLRRNLRDPDSLAIDHVFARTATTICVAYRARNGFGGMNRGFAVVTPTTLSSDAARWNRDCVGDGFYDVDPWGL
jgi:hypothetical protein